MKQASPYLFVGDEVVWTFDSEYRGLFRIIDIFPSAQRLNEVGHPMVMARVVPLDMAQFVALELQEKHVPKTETFSIELPLHTLRPVVHHTLH
ncbi:hypothetical protein ACB087_10045 (plasmid) [Vibrio sp. VNB-15]